MIALTGSDGLPSQINQVNRPGLKREDETMNGLEMIFAACESKEQEAKRLKINAQWEEYSHWLNNYRREHNAEPPLALCDNIYAAIGKNLIGG